VQPIECAGGPGEESVEADRSAVGDRPHIDSLLPWARLAPGSSVTKRNLAYLQTDLSDPEFRRHLARHARTTRAGLRRLIEAAVRAGELDPGTPAARLARTVESILSGSMLTWVIYQQGTATRWIRADLEAVVWPYRIGKAETGPRKR